MIERMEPTSGLEPLTCRLRIAKSLPLPTERQKTCGFSRERILLALSRINTACLRLSLIRRAHSGHSFSKQKRAELEQAVIPTPNRVNEFRKQAKGELFAPALAAVSQLRDDQILSP
jgi:hypothetical protein